MKFIQKKKKKKITVITSYWIIYLLRKIKKSSKKKQNQGHFRSAKSKQYCLTKVLNMWLESSNMVV